MADRRAPRGTSSPRRRRNWILASLLVVVLVVIALGAMALPLLRVQSDARQAKDELVRASAALRAKDPTQARVHVTKARELLDTAEGKAGGFSADVWAHVPFFGSAVSDMRHLLKALDASTTVADTAVKVFPEVNDPKQVNALVSADGVDLERVERILGQMRPAMNQLVAARRDLDEIQADAPFVSGRIADFRDQASDQILPLASGADRLLPVADVFPKLFGAGQENKYLVAFLNPAEQRWSGGAPLAYVDMTVKGGKLTFGEYQEANLGGRSNGKTWEGVPGNPWHIPDMRRLQKATFNPNWPTSGEELLRGFKAKGLGSYDSLLALDVDAVATLMGPTGSVDVPGVGPVSQGNVVSTLVGSYDKYQTPEQRRVVNRAVADLFRAKFLGGSNILEKARAIGKAASERHLAVYSRTPDVQKAISEIGLSGAISTTDHDYLGVFSRNNNDSKADFWQRRTVTSQVNLQENGSAKVKMAVTLKNVAPPFQPHQFEPTDPGRGYFTRRLNARVLTLLPKGAHDIEVTQSGGKMLSGKDGARPYFNVGMDLARQTSKTADYAYTVPKAAVRDGDTLTYHLDYDPQGMVVPQRLGVTLKAPAGWRVAKVPSGWRTTGSGATYATRPTAAVHSWEIVLHKD